MSIERCSKAYSPDGKCTGQVLQVLPSIDLAGWKNRLAAANTSLSPKEVGHYRLVVSGKLTNPITFEVTPVNNPKVTVPSAPASPKVSKTAK